MACLRPISIRQKLPGGEYVKLRDVTSRPEFRSSRVEAYRMVPCGRCVNCVKRFAMTWRVRGALEFNACRARGEPMSMLLLTFGSPHLPDDDEIRLMLRKFHKSERRRIQTLYEREGLKPPPYRYLGCIENGSRNGRPHVHLLMFGRASLGNPAAPRAKIHDYPGWPHGYVADETPRFLQSVSYVCSYLLKAARDGYQARMVMSKRPGIGLEVIREAGRREVLLHPQYRSVEYYRRGFLYFGKLGEIPALVANQGSVRRHYELGWAQAGGIPPRKQWTAEMEDEWERVWNSSEMEPVRRAAAEKDSRLKDTYSGRSLSPQYAKPPPTFKDVQIGGFTARPMNPLTTAKASRR